MRGIGIALAVTISAYAAQADVFNMGTGLTSLEFVTVGNPGNAADDTGYGRVDYTYDIGKFEVTAGQYTGFLNSVAGTDTYGLYNIDMDYDAIPSKAGCNIKRTGSSGSYSYSVVDVWANHPVNHIFWGDAARFANWLHNGQPTGEQNLSTTEDGAYYLNGVTGNAALLAVDRKEDWKWSIPTEDEWYKAAYHKNDGDTGNYYDYPMGTDAVPDNGNPGGDTGNSANFYDGDHAIGGQLPMDVGFFSQSDSPYGTFDQGGNLWELNDTVMGGSERGRRGGAFGTDSHQDWHLHASSRSSLDPTLAGGNTGFRVVQIPEPATMSFLIIGGVFLARKRK